VFERLAVDEFHDDVGEVWGFAVVEYTDDIRMAEAAGGLGFAAEAGEFLQSFMVVRGG
jgi:hypothetical protein